MQHQDSRVPSAPGGWQAGKEWQRAWKRSSKVATDRFARRSHSCAGDSCVSACHSRPGSGPQPGRTTPADQLSKCSARTSHVIQNSAKPLESPWERQHWPCTSAKTHTATMRTPAPLQSQGGLVLHWPCTSAKTYVATMGTPAPQQCWGGERALAVASSEPLTSSGGPRFSGQQLFTKLSCSAIFFTCAAECLLTALS